MEEEKIYRTLPVELTEEEKIKLGNELAVLNINIEAKTNLKKVLPKQIESLQEAAAEKTHILKTGTKQANVECYYNLDDPNPGQKTLYRVDNSEKVITENMDLLDVKENDESPWIENDKTNIVFDILQAGNEEKFTEITPNDFIDDLAAKNIFTEEEIIGICEAFQSQFTTENNENILIEEKDFPELKKFIYSILVADESGDEEQETEDENIPDEESAEIPENEEVVNES